MIKEEFKYFILITQHIYCNSKQEAANNPSSLAAFEWLFPHPEKITIKNCKFQ